MSGREYAGWMALFRVQHEEAERHRDEMESGDGQVFDPRAERDEDDEDDGEAE